ncbi:hypothetical protein [Caballeronia sordidicola]|uniref:Uncharacterized protein n=1 Tax=Caballeronia sordidicola TaxID=196367 RepID=A0A242N5F0_CABSO|nr:hypothetical protein [Caballeronia sordidicola]OTP78877.1 hypothetical protein PAMC26577_03005 [Caballeronia sordidicola]
MSFQNFLCINQKRKPIPYGGDGVLREDGDANYGFVCLKGALDRVDAVPELARDAALRRLAIAVNGNTTALQSVGCLSSPVNEDAKHRHTGYFEFAFNSRSRIADASNYFPPFFHFDRMLSALRDIRPVIYHWELQPCTFTERENATGFSCGVTVDTHWAPSSEVADSDWEHSIEHLTTFLQQIGPPADDLIY